MFVELNFKAETYKVKEFATSIGSLPFSLLAAGAALIGMDLSFMSLTNSTLDMGNALLMFQAQTGETTDYLERWEMAGRRVNVQNETVAGSFQKMMAAITQLRTFGTGPAGEMFGRLGIGGFMSKSPEQLMTEIRAKYLALKDPKAIQDFWAKAGNLIDPSMARVFQGPDPAKMHTLLGAGGKETAAELTAELAKLTDEIKADFVPVLKMLMPTLKELAEGITSVVRFFSTTKIDPGKMVYDAGRRSRFALDRMTSGIDDTMDRFFHTGPYRNVSPVVVHQNFYGDVDKNDIDAGALSLEHSLIRASRQLNRGGR